MTIIRGITVSYVKHLGLDESEVMEKFKQHQGEFKEKASPLIKSHTPTTYTPSSGKPLRFGSYSERKEQSQLAHWLSTKRTLYAVLVIAAFGLIILLMNLGKKASQEVSLDAPTVVETGNVNAPLPQPQPQETKIVDQKASEGSALFAGNPPYDFTIKAEGDVWFNMQIDDQSLISFKLSAGQERKIAFNRRARVTFSNPLLTKFQISGATYKSTAPLGKDETLIFPDQSNKLVQAN